MMANARNVVVQLALHALGWLEFSFALPDGVGDGLERVLVSLVAVPRLRLPLRLTPLLVFVVVGVHGEDLDAVAPVAPAIVYVLFRSRRWPRPVAGNAVWRQRLPGRLRRWSCRSAASERSFSVVLSSWRRSSSSACGRHRRRLSDRLVNRFATSSQQLLTVVVAGGRGRADRGETALLDSKTVGLPVRRPVCLVRIARLVVPGMQPCRGLVARLANDRLQRQPEAREVAAAVRAVSLGSRRRLGVGGCSQVVRVDGTVGDPHPSPGTGRRVRSSIRRRGGRAVGRLAALVSRAAGYRAG